MPVGKESHRRQPHSTVPMSVVTHVVCHEHQHEEERYEDDHSVKQRPVQLGSLTDSRGPTRLSSARAQAGHRGEDPLRSVFTTFATSVSTPKPDFPFSLLGENLPIEPLRVRSQPLVEHSQENDCNQGKHEAGVRPDVP